MIWKHVIEQHLVLAINYIDKKVVLIMNKM